MIGWVLATAMAAATVLPQADVSLTAATTATCHNVAGRVAELDELSVAMFIYTLDTGGYVIPAGGVTDRNGPFSGCLGPLTYGKSRVTSWIFVGTSKKTLRELGGTVEATKPVRFNTLPENLDVYSYGQVPKS